VCAVEAGGLLPRASVPEIEDSPQKAYANPLMSRRIASALLVSIALAAIVLRAAKAHTTGILYDEAVTWFTYASSLEAALTRYDSTNNHLLNSIAIWAAHGLFGGYEHFIRIPSMLASVGFVLACAYASTRIISDRWLRLPVLAVILFHFFVFDMSYLARGYSFALAASLGALAFTLWLETRPASRGLLWLTACVMALCNFVALGSMLTSVLAMLVLNAVCFGRLFVRMRESRVLVVQAAAVALLLTLAASGALYSSVIDDVVRHGSRGQGAISASEFFQTLLDERLFEPLGDPDLRRLATRSVAVLVAAALLGLAALCSGFGRSDERRVEKALVWIVALSTLAGTLFYGFVLERSLGHQRNHLSLYPMIWLALGAALDSLIALVRSQPLRSVAVVVVGLLVAPYVALNLPDAREVKFNYWWRQSNGRSILRRLHARDPERVWVIKAVPKHRFALYAMQYYQQFGYRFRKAGVDEEFDLILFDLPQRYIE